MQLHDTLTGISLCYTASGTKVVKCDLRSGEILTIPVTDEIWDKGVSGNLSLVSPLPETKRSERPIIPYLDLRTFVLKESPFSSVVIVFDSVNKKMTVMNGKASDGRVGSTTVDAPETTTVPAKGNSHPGASATIADGRGNTLRVDANGGFGSREPRSYTVTVNTKETYWVSEMSIRLSQKDGRGYVWRCRVLTLIPFTAGQAGQYLIISTNPDGVVVASVVDATGAYSYWFKADTTEDLAGRRFFEEWMNVIDVPTVVISKPPKYPLSV